MNGMMLEEFALRFTQALTHFMWIGVLLALVVYAWDRLLVRTAPGRHALHLVGVLLLALALPVSATGRGGAPLRHRVLRLLGQSDRTPVRPGRAGWILGAVALTGVVLAAATGTAVREDLADFDFDDPPGGYEKGIRVADRNHAIKVGGIRFRLSQLEEDGEGFLQADLGVGQGFEVLEFRLFDHETREVLHSSEQQRPGEHGMQFFVERVSATEHIRLREVGGVFPEKIDLWLRLIETRPGGTIRLPARKGGTTRWGKSEIVVKIFHVLPEAAKGRTYAFAVAMPDGFPVAGLIEISDADRKGETLKIRHRFLPTASARQVFVVEETVIMEGNELSIIDTSDKAIAGARVRFAKHLLVKGKNVVIGEAVSGADGKVAIPDEALRDPKILTVTATWLPIICAPSRTKTASFASKAFRLVRCGSAYSDITVLSDGRIGVLFERDNHTKVDLAILPALVGPSSDDK